MKEVNHQYMKYLFRVGKRLIAGLTIALIATLSLPISAMALSIESMGTLPSPTVLSPVHHEREVVSKPLITGVAKSKTRVAVYLDGAYNGDAKVKNHKSGTASWSYTPFHDLKPGVHVVEARSIDPESKLQSVLSPELPFEVEAPLPSPTLAIPVVNNQTTSLRPFIVGVAPSNTFVEIFIDGQLNGSMQTAEHASGTSSFRYRPFLSLEPDVDHVVKVRAIDRNGKRSEDSVSITFQTIAEVIVADESSEETEEIEEETTSEETSVGDLKEEGEILGEATTEKEESKDTEEKDESSSAASSEGSTNVNAVSGTTDTKTDDNASNNSTIGWVILGLIVLALLWRGRKTLFGKGDGMPDIVKEQHRPDSSSTTTSSLQHSAQTANGHDKNSFQPKEPEKHTPPPPPPASSY